MGCGSSVIGRQGTFTLAAAAHAEAAAATEATAVPFPKVASVVNTRSDFKINGDIADVVSGVSKDFEGQTPAIAAAVLTHVDAAAASGAFTEAAAPVDANHQTAVISSAIHQTAVISPAEALTQPQICSACERISVSHNFGISQLDVCSRPPPHDYISQLTTVVENMSGGQQASEASYALGAGGGTKQDSKDEKAFSEMLKGASAGRECVQMPSPPPHKGIWLRVLNRASGVYLYIHTETQRVVSSRPIDYVQPASAEDATLALPKEDFEGHRSCLLTAWRSGVTAALNEGFTPLLLCPDTVYDELKTIMAADATVCIMDVKPLSPSGLRTKASRHSARPRASLFLLSAHPQVKFPDCMEQFSRMTISQCVQQGLLLVIDMEQDAINFSEKVCNAPKYKGMVPHGIFDASSYLHDATQPKEELAPPPPWVSRALFKADPPELVPAGFGVCLLSGLNPPQASKLLAKDFEPFWSAIVPTLVRVRAVEPLSRFDLPQLLKYHAINGTIRPWFYSARGSPRTTFSDESLGEVEESSAPLLTPLLLDSSSSGYVDTWLQHGRTNIIDCQIMELACAREPEVGRLAALETCRKLLVTAMKEGSTLVIKMGHGGNRAVQFVQGGFAAPDYLPSCIFEPGAVCNPAVWNLFVRTEDNHREGGSQIFAIRPGFNVVVTSTCEAKTYRRSLHMLLPLHRMRVLQVLQ